MALKFYNQCFIKFQIYIEEEFEVRLVIFIYIC